MKTLTIHKNLFDEDYYEPIQALSWKQPFGSLMLHGKIETREWPTVHFGKVLICTSQAGYNEQVLASMTHEHQREKIKELLKDDPTAELNGFAIATGVLSECRPMLPEDEEMCFVKFRNGLYVHVYKDVRRIWPIKFKGAQKWKHVEDQKFLSQIKYIT